MSSELSPGLIAFIVIFVVAMIVGYIATNGKKANLNIKRRVVGDNQLGAARWATEKEKHESVKRIRYEPEAWRAGERLPTDEGFIIGYIKSGKKIYALVDTADNHTLMISAPGGGKTTSLMIPNIEYALATGMSFISTDSKGEILERYGNIANWYGYTPYIVDYRNPTKSMPNNLLQPMNQYYDLFRETGDIKYRSLAERHAKIIASSIVRSKGFTDAGQNAYFYDAAEGLIAAVCLLVTECCERSERHIVTVFKLVLEMTKPGKTSTAKKAVSRLAEIMELLPEEHKAKWLAGSAMSGIGQSISNVLSTAMTRLLSFVDSETEQILCFDSPINMEDICKHKIAVFIVFPEEDKTKHVLVSLMLSQMYQAAFTYADLHEGKFLKRRLYIYADEFGILPPQDNVKNVFAAARSRNIIIAPAVQTLAQLDDLYGHNGARTIKGCSQTAIYGGFAPLSDDIEPLAKGLGNQTIASSSTSHSTSYNGGKNTSQSQQMARRELMTAEELKHLPDRHWVVERKSRQPFISYMPYFTEWGITLDHPFEADGYGGLRNVSYGSCDRLESIIRLIYKTRRVHVPVNHDSEFGDSSEPISPDSY